MTAKTAAKGEAAAFARLLELVAEQLGVTVEDVDESPITLWLTYRVTQGRGALQFCYTEGGDIGIFLDGSEECLGSGYTAEEALRDATRKWRETDAIKIAEAIHG